MNILFDINHPAHVHLFRNAIKILCDQGHSTYVVAREKDVTVQLLKNYQIEHITLSSYERNLVGLGKELLVRQAKLFPILRKNKIDVAVSVTGATCVHVCKLLGIPTLVFYDTEHAKLQLNLTIPFATYFITPDAFWDRYGKNHLTYKGFHDLAYLHPKYFSPDPEVLKRIGVMSPDEKFVIIRFIAWKAAHDIGQQGLSLEFKRRIIELVRSRAKVFIVPEAKIEPEFEQYRLQVRPADIFDLLAYATMYIGEGGSMATEAAILGTPSIFTSTLDAGVFKELENNFGLMYAFGPGKEDAILDKVKELLMDDNTKKQWQKKREILLQSKIDVTDWMVKKILEISIKR